MAWSHLWNDLLLWVTSHPQLTYLIVLLVSLSESLVRNFTENGRVVRGKTATSRSEATLDFFLCL